MSGFGYVKNIIKVFRLSSKGDIKGLRIAVLNCDHVVLMNGRLVAIC